LPKLRSLFHLLHVFSLPPPHLFLSLTCLSPLMNPEVKGAICLTASQCTDYRHDPSTPLGPHSRLQGRFHTASAQPRGSQSCLQAGRRTANLPGKCMEVFPPLVFSGVYSDGRQEHQRIFFLLLKNYPFYQKQSAVKNCLLYQNTLFVVDYFATSVFKNPC